MALLTAEDIFRLHPKIRWAALSNGPDSLVFSQMRPGVKSWTAEADDKAFMEMGPIFLTGVAERLSPDDRAGKLRCVITCFEKDSVMIMQVREGHLAISVEEDDALGVFKQVMPQIEKLIKT